MQNDMGHGDDLHTFRGRTMQDAVNLLKESLGADAVIVKTRRARDKNGRFVEITARPSPLAIAATTAVAGAGPKGVTAAYAQTAAITSQLQATGFAGATVGGPAKPFAERAAWLASQIQQRQAQVPAISPSGGLPPELAALRQGALPSQGGAAPASPVQNTQATQYAMVDPIEEPVSQWDDDNLVNAGAGQGRTGQGGELESMKAEIKKLKAMVAGLTGPGEALVDEDEPQVAPVTVTGAELSEAVKSLDVRVDEIKALLNSKVSHERWDAIESVTNHLIQLGVADSHAQELAERVIRAVPEGTIDDGDVLSILERLMADDLMCGGSLEAQGQRQRILAFVGPTGVGKTTTIAKVASQARIDGKSVALINIDTLHLVAAERLSQYASILDAPLKTVTDRASFQAALLELAEHDVILIDTNGRNPRADAQVDSLAEFFEPGWGGEIVLTMACSTRERDLFKAIDSFGRLGVERLCMTKVDETDSYGSIYSVVRRACRPLVWLTQGQRIPDDIQNASSAELARQILGAPGAPTLDLAV